MALMKVTVSALVVLLSLTLAHAADDLCKKLQPTENFDNDKISNGLWFEVFTSSYEYNAACVNLFIEYTEKNISTLLTVKDKDSGKMKYWKSVLKTTPTKGMYEGPNGKHVVIKTDYDNWYVFIMCASDDDTKNPPNRIITFATRSENGEISKTAQEGFDKIKEEMKAANIDPALLKPVEFKDCPKPSVENSKAISAAMGATLEPIDVTAA